MIQKLLEKQWWNGEEDEIKRVKEYEFRVEEYVDGLFIINVIIWKMWFYLEMD